MGVWEYGSMGVWEYGSMGVWEYGSMGVWECKYVKFFLSEGEFLIFFFGNLMCFVLSKLNLAIQPYFVKSKARSQQTQLRQAFGRWRQRISAGARTKPLTIDP
jgi:hypothetical protein